MHIKSFWRKQMLDKCEVLRCFIELHEEKIDSLKKAIIESRRDIANSRDRNDSRDDPIKSQFSDLIKGMERSLFEHEEILSRLRSIQISGCDDISFGSLVDVENVGTGERGMYFIICVGGYTIDVDKNKISSISLKAPFTKALISKKENEEFHFMDQRFRIVEIQ